MTPDRVIQWCRSVTDNNYSFLCLNLTFWRHFVKPQFCQYFYRPQRSCAQGNIFTLVCHSVHRGGLPQCMLGYQPPWADTLLRSRHPSQSRTPREQTPPLGGPPPRPHPPLGADTPGADPPWTTPRSRTPPGSRHSPNHTTPPGPDPPSLEQNPPREADYGIRSTSGRYASNWNAFLLTFVLNLQLHCKW